VRCAGILFARKLLTHALRGNSYYSVWVLLCYGLSEYTSGAASFVLYSPIAICTEIGEYGCEGLVVHINLLQPAVACRVTVHSVQRALFKALNDIYTFITSSLQTSLAACPIEVRAYHLTVRCRTILYQ